MAHIVRCNDNIFITGTKGEGNNKKKAYNNMQQYVSRCCLQLSRAAEEEAHVCACAPLVVHA